MRVFAQGWLNWTRKIIAFGHVEAESRDSLKKVVKELSEEEPSEGGIWLKIMSCTSINYITVNSLNGID